MHEELRISADYTAAMPPTDARGGLCASCRFRRDVTSGRGSTFLLCERSRTDPRFPKYPPLPVTRCAGYEPTTATTDSKREQ